MVIFELDKKQALNSFTEIKRIMIAAKSWKITSCIEITVLDGKIQLVGQGFVKEVEAFTTGSCKLVFPVLHWFEIINMSREKILKVVVTEGEAMVNKVTVWVQTTFFETDKILKSIPLPANPAAIDYLILEYKGFTEDELQFNSVHTKIPRAKREFEECIRKAALLLRPFRISKTELREMVLQKMREKEKIDFNI